MAFFAIKGYDDLYDGLHGMYDLDVIEVDNEKIACAIARELAEGVIQSYYEIEEQIEADIREECEAQGIEYGAGFIEEEYIRDEMYNCDIMYEVFELDENKLPTKDCRELENMYWEDEEEFLRTFQKVT